MRIPPKKATSFITTLPKRGNFKTKLRYKLLGFTKFYYSNIFDGTIDYCQFKISDQYSYAYGGERYYTLDTFRVHNREEFYDFISLD